MTPRSVERNAVDRNAVATLPSGPPVPFITARTGEELVSRHLLVVRPDGMGVGYRQETPADRDAHRVLWVRSSPPDAEARPCWRKVHPIRQREVMLGMRCQVCAGPPSRTSRGLLFLHKERPDADRRWWPNSELTSHPPLCLPCAAVAVRYCGFAATVRAVRVRKPRIHGVFGITFTADRHGNLEPLAGDDGQCAYSDAVKRRWTVALQVVAQLNRCTPVDLDEELRAAGITPPDRIA